MVSLLTVIGGIGFFLLGMNLMTEGLKTMAGDALRQLLNRFTGGTLSSIATGTVMTLLAQSSTATTLMTLGFVSAGMLTFLQAAGVIFGANLGSTSTGWIVAALGMKFSVSQLALPLIGFGVVMRQFRRRNLASLGNVLTGFGLLFIGIQFLQNGMAGMNELLDLSGLPGASPLARLVLILAGIAMTVVMQASSAAVAATITLLAAGTIDMEQAVSLVIGQNIGTTATVAIASIGASIPAKRTALTHILFNVFTGLVAYLLFPLLISGLEWSSGQLNWQDPALVLALFHTSFSLMGIVIFGPLIRRFTALIERMLPERMSAVTQHLDEQIVLIPSIAVEAVSRSLKEAARLIIAATRGKLDSLVAGSASYGAGLKYDRELERVQIDIDYVRDFIALIRTDSPETSANYISALHALDHLDRMSRLVQTSMNAVVFTKHSGEVHDVVGELRQALTQAVEALAGNTLASAVPELSRFSRQLAGFRKQERSTTFDVTASGEVPIRDAFHYVQLILLIDGIAYHLWRMSVHLAGETQDSPAVAREEG